MPSVSRPGAKVHVWLESIGVQYGQRTRWMEKTPPPPGLPELIAPKWVSRRQKGVFEFRFPVNVRMASSTDFDINGLYEFYTVSKRWRCSSFCFSNPAVLSRRQVQILAGEVWIVGKCQADEGCHQEQNPQSVAPPTQVFITKPTPSAVTIGNKTLVWRSRRSSWVFVTYHRIPWPSAQAHTIVAHTQTTNAIFVAVEAADPITSKHIPNLDDSLVSKGATFGERLDSMRLSRDGVWAESH